MAPVRGAERRLRCRLGLKPSVIAVLGPTAPGRARWRWRWPSASTARSSTAIRRPSIAASTSAPTRCRSPSGAASRITSIDIADPTDEYTRRAVCARRGRSRSATSTRAAALPILVGGTGFYYRALTRGLFPGPGRGRGAARAAECDRGSARRRAAASDAAARRSRVGARVSSRATGSGSCARSRCTF